MFIICYPRDSIILYTHDIHSHKTRNSTSKTMTLTRYSTNRSQNSIKYKGIKIWNSIPNHMKSFSFRKFKLECKSFLLDKCTVVNLVEKLLCLLA